MSDIVMEVLSNAMISTKIVKTLSASPQINHDLDRVLVLSVVMIMYIPIKLLHSKQARYHCLTVFLFS
jgi:hypothetical protein